MYVQLHLLYGKSCLASSPDYLWLHLFSDINHVSCTTKIHPDLQTRINAGLLQQIRHILFCTSSFYTFSQTFKDSIYTKDITKLKHLPKNTFIYLALFSALTT